MPGIAFKKVYVEPILKGKKTQTVRLGTSLTEGETLVAHCRWGDPPFAHLRVTEIIRKGINDLTDDDALRDGYANRGDLVEAVQTFYPHAEQVALIRFELVAPGAGETAQS